MKKTMLLTTTVFFLVAGFVMFAGCDLTAVDDDDPIATTPTPTNTNGTYVFWARKDLGQGKISVYLDNVYQGQIEYYYPNGVNCTDGYSLTVSQAPGTYNFTAQGANGANWNSTVTFTSGGCQKLELTSSNTGSGGGGGGGGGSSNGKVVFWTKTNLGYGKINLYYDNVNVGQITQYHPGGLTDCSQDPNLTIQRSNDTYNWVAISDVGWWWRGLVVYSTGSCRLIEFTQQNKEDCLYHLDGTWVRQNDGPTTGAKGMVINYANKIGTIQSVGANSRGFAAGQVKWKELDNSNCLIRDLENVSTMYYNVHDVQVTDLNHIVINGNAIDPNDRVYYTRQ